MDRFLNELLPTLRPGERVRQSGAARRREARLGILRSVVEAGACCRERLQAGRQGCRPVGHRGSLGGHEGVAPEDQGRIDRPGSLSGEEAGETAMLLRAQENRRGNRSQQQDADGAEADDNCQGKYG